MWELQCNYSVLSFPNEQVQNICGKGKTDCYFFLYTALKFASWYSTCGQLGSGPKYSNKDVQFNNLYLLVFVIPNRLLLLLA